MLQKTHDFCKAFVSKLSTWLKDKRSKAAFITTGVCSIFAYLYYLNNLIHNNDMISCTPKGVGESIRSGRWGLYLLSEAVEKHWGGHFNLPAFNVLLALVIIGFTAALLIRVLDIRRIGLCVCISAITVTIPAFATVMFFAYNVQYYALSIFFMVLAAYLLKKKGLLNFGIGALSACFSLGIYQAYLPFFAVLLLLLLISKCLQEESTPKELILTGCKYLGAMVVSYILYSLILRLMLANLHLELSDYQSINTMGALRLSGIKKAVLDVLRLPFTTNYYGFSATRVTRFAIAVSFLCIGFAVLGLKKIGLPKFFLLLGFLSMLLVAVNSTHILSADSVLYTRMTLGLIGIFYLPIVLLEKISFRKTALRGVLLLILIPTLLLCSANYAWQSNGNYLSVQYGNLKAENYYVTMFTRIRSAEGYNDDLPIVYVGKTISDKALQDNWNQPPFKYTAIMGSKAQLNQYSRNNFIMNYLGYSWRSITETEAEKYEDLISDMACYPDDGSIVATEDLVIIRLE